MERDASALLARYGLTIDVSAPLSAYSVAIRQIIAIARAVDLSGKVLVLDEPTASLDAREVEMLFGVLRQLKAEGLGIIVITHFLDQVYAIADCATVLRNGRLVGSRDLSELPRTDLISMMLGHQLQETVRRQLTEEVSDDTLAPIHFSGFGKKAASPLRSCDQAGRSSRHCRFARIGTHRNSTADVRRRSGGQRRTDSGRQRDKTADTRGSYC